MQYLLLNPTGRILKNRFWQGLVVLTVAIVILQATQVYLAPEIGLATTAIFLLPQLALIYVQVCIYGKRFHDAGTTAWWIIAVWLGSIIIATVLDAFLGPLFLGEEGRQMQAEVLERMQQGELQIAAEAAFYIADKKLPLTLLTEIISAVILGFIVGALATEPRENKHGPVPGREDDTFG